MTESLIHKLMQGKKRISDLKARSAEESQSEEELQECSAQ